MGASGGCGRAEYANGGASVTLSPNGATSETPDYGTHPTIVGVAREVMGGIDLDPATTAVVNSWHVKAARYIEPPGNGLANVWHGRVFLNPPGGRNNDSIEWWEHMVREYAAGRLLTGFYVSFALDKLQTGQRKIPLTTFPTFIAAKRVPYLVHDTVEKVRKNKKTGVVRIVKMTAGDVDKQPPKASCFTWVHPRDVAPAAAARTLQDAFTRAGVKGVTVLG